MARRRWIDVIFGGLLLVSLAANLWGWRVQPGGPSRSEAAETTTESPARQRELPAGRPGPVALDPCVERASWLKSELTELERLRAAHLPRPQRFAELPPNPELGAALTAELGRHLPPELAASLERECRGDACRIGLPPRVDSRPWLARLRESTWLGETLHEVPGPGHAVWFERHAAGSVSSSDLLQQALQDFEASGAIAACQDRHGRNSGTLEAVLSLAPAPPQGAASAEDPGIVVETGGRLAGTALGSCIDQELRRAVAARTLPPRHQRADLLAQYPLP